MTISADDNYSRCSQCDERFETEALTERGDDRDLWCRGCIEDEESPGRESGRDAASGRTTALPRGQTADMSAAPELPGCGVCDDPGCTGCCDVCNDPECYRNKGSRSTRQPVSAGHIRD